MPRLSEAQFTLDGFSRCPWGRATCSLRNPVDVGSWPLGWYLAISAKTTQWEPPSWTGHLHTFAEKAPIIYHLPLKAIQSGKEQTCCTNGCYYLWILFGSNPKSRSQKDWTVILSYSLDYNCFSNLACFLFWGLPVYTYVYIYIYICIYIYHCTYV